MVQNYLAFKSLFDIWRRRNYDPYFYFAEIFDKAVEAAEARAKEDGIDLGQAGNPRYQAFFIPVGLSMENVVLIASLLKPNHLGLAFTEMSRHFHQKHATLMRDNIKKLNPTVSIREIALQSDDQRLAEHKIVDWVEEMSAGYGLSYGQMAIDLTGGTKPMSIGAHNAALSFDGIDAYYLRVDYDEETQWPIPGTETLVPMVRAKAQTEKDLVFVIMPFADEFAEVYERGIKETIEGLSQRSVRVDEEIFTGGIMDRIRDNLLRANIVIAELTKQNANVYYELGLAHAYGKKVIMLTQDIKKVPFDLRHLRMVVYQKDNVRQLGRNACERNTARTVGAVECRPYNLGKFAKWGMRPPNSSLTTEYENQATP